jgi:hypothetical protein
VYYERQRDENRELPRTYAARSLGWVLLDVLGIDPRAIDNLCTRFARKSHNATLSYFLPSLAHLAPPILPRTWPLHIVHNSYRPRVNCGVLEYDAYRRGGYYTNGGAAKARLLGYLPVDV